MLWGCSNFPSTHDYHFIAHISILISFSILITLEKELQLPDENSLSSEAKAFREQFKRCYLAKCRARIGACRRNLLRTYNGAFTGSDLVDWLLEAGVAKDRDEAIYYGRCLLDSRVLNHVDGTQHFHDRNLLYTFSA